MILSSKTRNQVNVGTMLQGYSESYLVTSIDNNGRSIHITTQVIKDGVKSTHIYFQPISYYYGCKFGL